MAASASRLSGNAPERLGLARLAAALSKRWFRGLLYLIGIATAPLIVLQLVRDGGLAALDTIAVLTVLVAWSFVASGFVAWDRRPEKPIGALLLFLGLWWTAGQLMRPPTTSSPLLYTVGEVWRLMWVFGFVLVLLTFPSGRLSRPLDRLLAGILLFTALVSLVIFAVVAIAAGIVAAILPARRASRLNVLEALQYE